MFVMSDSTLVELKRLITQESDNTTVTGGDNVEGSEWDLEFQIGDRVEVHRGEITSSTFSEHRGKRFNFSNALHQ